MSSPVSNRTRMLTMLGTIISQFALGSVYTWSLFNAQLSDKLTEPVSSVAFSFGILSLALAFASSISGALQERYGIRKVSIVSGLLIGVSLYFTGHATNLTMLYIFGGIMLGLADGTGYLMIMSNCVRFFPKSKGLASACAIGAYGLGALAFKYFHMYFLTNFGVETAFEAWGLVCMIMILIGAMMITDAPVQDVEESGVQAHDYTLKEAMATRQFWMLCTMFLTVCMSGLYVIGVAKDIGENYVHLSMITAAASVSVIAVGNLGGRLILGVLSDRIQRVRVVTIALLTCLVGVCSLLFLPPSAMSFYVACFCIAFCFGGTITVYPTLVSDYFGLNNLTKNYGFVYLNFGIGSFLGSVVASIFGGFQATFELLIVLLIISVILSFFIKSPNSNQALKVSHSHAQ